MNKYILSKSEASELRKGYTRSIQLDFVAKSQLFICLADLNPDGGIAPSAAFFKAVDGKPSEFLFLYQRPVVDKMMAEYVFTQFFQKDGADVANSGEALTENKVNTKRRFAYQKNQKSLVEGATGSKSFSNEYGILRLEADGCCTSYGIEDINSNDLTQLGKSENLSTLSVSPFGVSRLAWLDAEGQFQKGDYIYDYEMIDKGMYEVVAESEVSKDLLFHGTKLKGLYRLNTADNQISAIGTSVEKSLEVPASSISNIYADLGIDTNNLGCIMLNTDPLQVGDIISEEDLFGYDETTPDYLKGFVSEGAPHVTLLYGLLQSGTEWGRYVNQLLNGLEFTSVTISEVGFFPSTNPETPYDCLIAKVEVTPVLQDANGRLRMLPHIDTFPEYQPHITLAYVQQGKATGLIPALNERFEGKNIKVTGLNYGQ